MRDVFMSLQFWVLSALRLLYKTKMVPSFP